MSNGCKISVVIPTHNRAEGLLAALESLRRQTYKDFTVIVVNDASSYDVSEVTGRFSSLNLQLINNEQSLGGNASRNKGVAAASGDYIAFLDDDDEFFERKLECIKGVIESDQGVDIIYHPSEICMVAERFSYKSGTQGFDNGVELRKSLLMGNTIGGTSMVTVKKQSLTELGGFDVKLRSLQDYEMWLRLAVAQKKFYFLDVPLTKYNHHRGTASITKSVDVYYESIRYIRGKYQDFYSALTPDEVRLLHLKDSRVVAYKSLLAGSWFDCFRIHFRLFRASFSMRDFLFLVLLLGGRKSVFKARSILS